MYPKPQITNILILLDASLKYLFSIDRFEKEIIKILMAVFLPPLMKNPIFSCPLIENESHKKYYAVIS